MKSSGRWITILLWFAALLISSTPAAAQQNTSTSVESADAATGVSELRATLDQLQAELENERSALADAKQRHDEALNETREKRDALAGELLELEAQRQRLAQRRRTLTDEVADADARVSHLAEQRDTMRAAAASLAERITVLLNELPGHATQRQQARQWAQALRADNSIAEGGETATTQPTDVVSGLLELANELHAESSSLRLTHTQLWTARGERETVDLLAIGHVAFAYRAPDGDRIGVALASPAEASGYRWTEQVPAAAAQSIRQAIEQLRADEPPPVVQLPIDVTGRLRADALAQERDLARTLAAGGPVMIPLGVVAALMLLLIAERIWVLYVRNGRSRRAAARALSASASGQTEEAERIAESTRGTVTRTLAACLRRRSQGQHAMEDSIQEQLLHEVPRLNRFLGGLAILAAIAPLLGLLGTVTGIIETFGVIQSFGNAEPGLMAGGISEALVTTACGLTLAIPVLLIHSALKGRVDRIIADAEKQAASLLNTLSHGQNAHAQSSRDAAHDPQPTEA